MVKEIVLCAILVLVAMLIVFASLGSWEAFREYGFGTKFAFALIIAATIRFTSVLLFRDTDAKAANIASIGIQDAHALLTDFDVVRRIQKATSVQIMKTWFPETDKVRDALVEVIQKCKGPVHLLLCHPDSPHLHARSLSTGEVGALGGYRNYKAVEAIARAWEKCPKADVQISFHWQWPGVPVLWLDRQTLVGFYINGNPSPAWPWLDLREDSLLEKACDAMYGDLLNAEDTKHLTSVTRMKEWLQEHQHHGKFEAGQAQSGS